MKWTPSGFGHDQVEFTWLDLFKMMIGKELKNGALVAKRACAAAIKTKKEKNNEQKN